jgi:hypothetical protein
MADHANQEIIMDRIQQLIDELEVVKSSVMTMTAGLKQLDRFMKGGPNFNNPVVIEEIENRVSSLTDLSERLYRIL